MSHLEFRLALSKLLVRDITGRRKIGRPQSKPLASAVQLEHLYFKISKTKRQCVNCRERAKRLKKANTPDEAQRPRESRSAMFIFFVKAIVLMNGIRKSPEFNVYRLKF